MNEKFLCRYRPNTQYAIESVLNKQIFAVNPNYLNDYVDCSINFDLNKLLKLLMNGVRCREFIISRAFTNNFNHEDFKTELEYKETKEKFAINCESKQIKPVNKIMLEKTVDKCVTEIIKSFRDYFGIVCFSENGGSQIMWSHYASDSSGFLLIYDYSLLEESARKGASKIFGFNDLQRKIFGLHKVKYVDKKTDHTQFLYRLFKKYVSTNSTFDKYISQYDVFNYMIKDEKDVECVIDILTTKSLEWKYEIEYRLIFPFEHSLSFDIEEEKNLDKDKFFNIGYVQPHFICLGEKMSLVNKAALALFTKINNRTILCKQDRLQMLTNKDMNYKFVNPDKILDEHKEN